MTVRPDTRRWLPSRRAVLLGLLVVAASAATVVTYRVATDDAGRVRPGDSVPSGTPTAGFVFRPPTDVAGSAPLREFVDPWNEYPWGEGCRTATDRGHQPDGTLGNPAGGRSAAVPAETVHCRNGDFEALFAWYERESDTARVFRAYQDSGKPGPESNVTIVDAWSATQRGLVWIDGAHQCVGVLLSSRPTTPLDEVWAEFAAR